jgi:hypothetical protein
VKRAPISKVRSSWLEAESILAGCREWIRNVTDGTLIALVGEEPGGWHLSISFRDHRGELTRYPRWDEIADARDQLLPADVGFVMHLPRTVEYVALHDTTFHLHEHPERDR